LPNPLEKIIEENIYIKKQSIQDGYERFALKHPLYRRLEKYAAR
jgi:hypothetical protein